MLKKIEEVFTTFVRFAFKLRRTTYDIAIVEFSYPSGSNTRILYEYLQSNYNYSILYLERTRPVNMVERIKEYVTFNSKLATAKLLVGTHGIRKIKKNQVTLNLWHGIPLKAMNYMEKDFPNPVEFKDDILVTSSLFESMLLTSCMFTPYAKHRHFGNPRLDYLMKSNSSGPLIDNIKRYKWCVIYMPTFRSQEASRDDGTFYGNLFNMPEFELEQFNEYLSKNDILLVAKYHPFEVSSLKEPINDYSNIISLTNEDLISNNLDLYELLPFTDLLITDYSSIYFDYLLLDKPIIFAPTDLKEYNETRGLLLQPYDNWTPGRKVLNQEEVETAILSELLNDTYRDARTKLKEIVFMEENTVGDNTRKTAVFISDLLEKE